MKCFVSNILTFKPADFTFLHFTIKTTDYAHMLSSYITYRFKQKKSTVRLLTLKPIDPNTQR